ncbi:MAG: ATP-binding protein [Bacteroidota bacterium]
MKQFICLLVFVLLNLFSHAQLSHIGLLTPRDSAILKQIENEGNATRRHELIKDLILLSDDKSPLSVLEEAKQLQAFAQKKKDGYAECVALSMYGQGYRITGDFTKALQYHYQAIELSKQLNNESLTGYTLNQSAHIFKDREENEKAIAIYSESGYYANKGNEPFFKFYPLMNLGFVYLNAKKPDSSLSASLQALKLMDGILATADEEIKAMVERSLYLYCISNLAGAYSVLNDKQNAGKYYRIGAAIIAKYRIAKTRYFQFFYLNLAQHYQRYNLIDSSLHAAKAAIESVINTPVEYLSAKPARLLSDYYENKNADSTVKYLKIYLRGNEVMNSTRVTQQLQMISVEEEQRNAEMKRAEKAYRDKLFMYLLGAAVLVIGFIAAYVYRTAQQRSRINKELSMQKQQVEKTLAELKSTQKQLIQSEKMASLGELTAGIAHEIQNPLNFVNNFSEISSELLAEMRQAMEKGDTDDAKQIMNDVIKNLEKINHHGKRADGIVKGMLQHSRSSSNQKELTNINALADEYLRLAYHGLRAKDKTFNVTLETEYDQTVGKIDIIPQDMGRVFLNLIANAFYSVKEKSKTSLKDYQPTVWLSTKRNKDAVIIAVKDNGSGIPQNIIDKIFQPFFTTKPTGQGTGLGLSLAYDIVKAHGGELKVETKEGEGTKFIILLSA